MKKPQPIRLVIAHSHTVLREGLRRLLESEGEFKVIGEASDGTEVVPLVRQLQPDILLIYPRLPKLSGWEALRELKTPANATSTRVILLEASIEERKIVETFQLGVRGIVLLEKLTSDLFKAIRTVMAGEYWVLREPLSNLENLQTLLQLRHEEERQKLFGITPQEREIVSAVVAGYSNREIAEYFKVGEDAVKGHLRNIFDKVGVSTRLELALFAANQGLLPLEGPPADSPHKPTAQSGSGAP
jgi:DNA-binding NarL/FixJ family response regulator